MWQERGGGHDGTARSCIVPFIDQSEYLSGLLDDSRINGILSSLLGDDFNYLGSDGNYYVGDTDWHSDGGWPRPIRYYKMAFYLDPLTRESGCLRVIPGSHRLQKPDLFAPLRQRSDEPDFRPFGTAPDEIPCVPLEVDPGDIVVFTECVLHGAFHGRPGRHQHAINFFNNPTTDAQIAELRGIYRRTNWSVRPTEALLKSERPRLQRMISRLVELGFEAARV